MKRIFSVCAMSLFLCCVFLQSMVFAGGKVASSGTYSCAITPTGGLKCWGSNQEGYLGIGKKKAPEQHGCQYWSSKALDVLGLTSGVISVSASDTHNCAVTKSGGLKCWGGEGVSVQTPGAVLGKFFQDGMEGCAKLGSGILGPEECSNPTCEIIDACSTKPLDVKGLTTGVKNVAVGHYFTCALLTNGTVKCWGNNNTGELGAGVTPRSVQYGGMTMYACTSLPIAVTGLSGVVDISAGVTNACALLKDGTVKCWGHNQYGQLGVGNNTGPEQCAGMACSAKPTTVSGLSGVVSMGVTGGGGCALLSSGKVKCWGTGFLGQPYYSTTQPTCDVVKDTSEMYSQMNPDAEPITSYYCAANYTPLEVPGLSGVKKLFVGSGACAITSDAKLLCWGAEASNYVPFEIKGINGAEIKDISISSTLCALLTSGQVKCWGANQDGSIGNGKFGDEQVIEGGQVADVWTIYDVLNFP